MRFTALALMERGMQPSTDPRVDGTQHAMRDRAVRALPAGLGLRVRRRPGDDLGARRTAPRGASAVSPVRNAEAGRVEVLIVRRLPAHAPRLRGRVPRDGRPGGDRVFPRGVRAVVAGPYDLSIVEGSITTADDIERSARSAASRVTWSSIGACATAGGIQALRNFADVREFTSDRVRASGVHPTRWTRQRHRPRISTWTSSCMAVRSTSTSCSR